MSQCNWVSREVLLLLHDESLAEHGGAPGLRNEDCWNPRLHAL